MLLLQVTHTVAATRDVLQALRGGPTPASPFHHKIEQMLLFFRVSGSGS
jgi:hypothetical protein